MNVSLLDRLNITHAAVAAAGTSRPTGWLDDQIVNPPTPDEEDKPPVSRPNKMAKRRTMKLAQAQKMSEDLDGYDSRIKAGRLQGEGP